MEPISNPVVGQTLPLVATVDFIDQAGVKVDDDSLYLDIAVTNRADVDQANTPLIEVDDARDVLTFMRAGTALLKASHVDSDGHTVQAVQTIKVVKSHQYDAADDAGKMLAEPRPSLAPLDCDGDKATLAMDVAHRLEYPAIGEFDQALCKAMPDAPGTTIVALSYKQPGAWCSDDDSRCGDYDLDVLLVDTTTLVVKARWQKKDANTSDADQFGGISIDTGQYWLAKGVRAFGIRANHYVPSHAVTASDSKLNLYIRQGNMLHAVVDGLSVRDEHESASDSCVDGVETSLSIIRMGTDYHHGLRDIATRTTSTLLSPQPENASCDGGTSTEHDLLEYDGDHYRE
jgi:hypothetical protein